MKSEADGGLTKHRQKSSSTNATSSTSSKQAPPVTDYDFLDAPNARTHDATDELHLDVDDESDAAARQAQLLDKRLRDEKRELKKSLLEDKSVYFNSRVCHLLTEYLTSFQLCGLTPIDQIHLVALADTVATVKCDVNFGHEEDLFKKTEFLEEAASSTSSNSHRQVVDNCGLKFLLAARSYNYLMRTLPTANRARLKEVGLGTANFAWAFHSDCEQELLSAILEKASSSSGGEKLTWADLRQYGVGWWLKGPTVLRQLAEQLAKNLFQRNSEPLDAALFYLAMKKKGVLWGLFKTVKDVKMAEFFKNDFNEAKWQTAALKNAFVLLGKQRFEHAAAFFLLAGRLKDAVEVCVRNLRDLQLAMVLVRLYETNFDDMISYLNRILSSEVLGVDLESSKLEGGKP